MYQLVRQLCCPLVSIFHSLKKRYLYITADLQETFVIQREAIRSKYNQRSTKYTVWARLGGREVKTLALLIFNKLSEDCELKYCLRSPCYPLQKGNQSLIFWVPLHSSSFSLLWCFETWHWINASIYLYVEVKCKRLLDHTWEYKTDIVFAKLICNHYWVLR